MLIQPGLAPQSLLSKQLNNQEPSELENKQNPSWMQPAASPPCVKFGSGFIEEVQGGLSGAGGIFRRGISWISGGQPGFRWSPLTLINTWLGTYWNNIDPVKVLMRADRKHVSIKDALELLAKTPAYKAYEAIRLFKTKVIGLTLDEIDKNNTPKAKEWAALNVKAVIEAAGTQDEGGPKSKQNWMWWLLGAAGVGISGITGLGAYMMQHRHNLQEAAKNARTWRQIKLGMGAATAIGILATIAGKLVMNQSEKASELKLKEMAFEYKQRFEGGFEKIDPRKIYPRLTFNSIVGQDDTLRELRSLANKIANPDLIKRFYPRGMYPRYLFQGPPGTGKTESIRALTCEVDQLMRRMGGEHKAIMYKLNGSLLSGADGARMLHQLKEAINALNEGDTAIIFLDEADSIPKKGKNTSPEDARVVNEFLELLDGIGGFKPGVNVPWFVSTNRPEEMEAAFKSRLRLPLYMGRPTQDDLKKLYKQKFSLARLTPEFKADLNAIAAKSYAAGFVGRDVNDVAELLKNWTMDRLQPGKALPNKLAFTEEDLNQAIEKIKEKVVLVNTEEKAAEPTPFKLSFNDGDLKQILEQITQKMGPTHTAPPTYAEATKDKLLSEAAPPAYTEATKDKLLSEAAPAYTALSA